MVDTNKTNELIKQEQPSNASVTTIQVYKQIAEEIVKSGLSPHKKAEDALVAIMAGKELGFSPMVALNNIHSINGKAAMGIHLLTALLLKNGIRYKVLQDFVSVEVPIANTDGKSNATKDRITTVEFTRWFKNPDGTNERVDTKFSFSMGEAKLQGLLDKDNWVRMPKIMLRSRAITLGARLVAPDILLGMYEVSEVLEIEHQDQQVVEHPEFTVHEEATIPPNE